MLNVWKYSFVTVINAYGIHVNKKYSYKFNIVHFPCNYIIYIYIYIYIYIKFNTNLLHSVLSNYVPTCFGVSSWPSTGSTKVDCAAYMPLNRSYNLDNAHSWSQARVELLLNEEIIYFFNIHPVQPSGSMQARPEHFLLLS